MKHILNLSPSENDILKIRRKLQEYYSAFFEMKDETRFVISEVDEDDKLIGEIVCTIVGKCLKIEFLKVSEDQGKGLGQKLFFETEENRCGKWVHKRIINYL